MASTYQIFINWQPADADLYTPITSLEVEESMDLPGARPVDAADLAHQRRRPDLRRRRALRAAGDARGRRDAGRQRRRRRCRRARPAAVAAACRRLAARPRNASSTATCCRRSSIWRPASPTPRSPSGARTPRWLMNLTEKVKEWVDVTDADVAASIFGDYGITPVDRQHGRRLALAHRGHPQPDAARLGHPVPAHAGAAQRQVLPRRLRRPARRSAPATSPCRTSTATRRSRSTLNDPQQLDGRRARPEWDATRADRGRSPAGPVQRQRPERRSAIPPTPA